MNKTTKIYEKSGGEPIKNSNQHRSIKHIVNFHFFWPPEADPEGFLGPPGVPKSTQKRYQTAIEKKETKQDRTHLLPRFGWNGSAASRGPVGGKREGVPSQDRSKCDLGVQHAPTQQSWGGGLFNPTGHAADPCFTLEA